MGAIVGRFANRIALANSVLMVSNINCLSIMRLIICMVASTVSIRNSGSWKMKMMVFFFPTQARMVKKAIPENLWCIFISNYHLIMSWQFVTTQLLMLPPLLTLPITDISIYTTQGINKGVCIFCSPLIKSKERQWSLINPDRSILPGSSKKTSPFYPLFTIKN